MDYDTGTILDILRQAYAPKERDLPPSLSGKGSPFHDKSLDLPETEGLPPFEPPPRSEYSHYLPGGEQPGEGAAARLGIAIDKGDVGGAASAGMELLPTVGAGIAGIGAKGARARQAGSAGPAEGRPFRAPETGAPGPFRGADPSAAERARGIARIYHPTPEAVERYKGAGATPLDLHELSPEAAEDLFSRALARVKEAHPSGSSVTQYSPEDYAKMRAFLTPEHQAGFGLKEGDDIVSVFRHPEAPYAKATAPMLDLAKQQGGARLDAFDTMLPHIYSRSGFQAISRVPFNPEFAPPDWNYEHYRPWNEGKPDVVFMAHNPHHGRLYQPGEGILAPDYDQAVELQRRAVQNIKGQGKAGGGPATGDVEVRQAATDRADENVRKAKQAALHAIVAGAVAGAGIHPAISFPAAIYSGERAAEALAQGARAHQEGWAAGGYEPRGIQEGESLFAGGGEVDIPPAFQQPDRPAIAQDYNSPAQDRWRTEPFAPLPGRYLPPWSGIDRYPDQYGAGPPDITPDRSKHMAEYLNRKYYIQEEGKPKDLPIDETVNRILAARGKLDPKTPDWAPWLNDAMPSISRMPVYSGDAVSIPAFKENRFALPNKRWPSQPDDGRWEHQGGAAGTLSELRWVEDNLAKLRPK